MYKIEKTKKKNAHISVIKLNTICFLNSNIGVV